MTRFTVTGETFTHPVYGDYKVVERENAHNITIEFCNTGYRSVVEHSAIHQNTVRDYEVPTVCGVGIIGEEFRGKTTRFKGAKSCWGDMLLRCYDENNLQYPAYGGRGVYVCESWLRFGNFLKWYLLHHKEGYQIDKDLLSPKGGLHYSPETCMFLPSKINNFLRSGYKTSKLPVGVCVNSRNPERYCAYIQYTHSGKRKNLGSAFLTPEMAFSVYRKEKEYDKAVCVTRWLQEGIICKMVADCILKYEILPYPP